MERFKPQDFVGCNLNDKEFLDNEGFLQSDALNDGNEILKKFGCYNLVYIFWKERKIIRLSIHDGVGSIIAVVNYFLKNPPDFKLIKPYKTVSKSLFLDTMISLDKDLANWMLWNI